MNAGITEKDFWDMTFAEIDRAIDTFNRKQLAEEKRQAIFDYTLADLIGHSVSRVYNSANQMPALFDAYPSLFDKEVEEEQMRKKREELSIARFRQFAQLTNKRFKEGEITTNE